jgi:hypothetical protein
MAGARRQNDHVASLHLYRATAVPAEFDAYATR